MSILLKKVIQKCLSFLFINKYVDVKKLSKKI